MTQLNLVGDSNLFAIVACDECGIECWWRPLADFRPLCRRCRREVWP
jgi:hypothetical protein